MPPALLVVVLRLLTAAHFQWSDPVYQAIENQSLWHLGILGMDRLNRGVPIPVRRRRVSAGKRVTLPPRELFISAEEEACTAMHGLSHSTGHQKRLAREGISELAPFGSPVCSREELVANSGRVFLRRSRNLERGHFESSRIRGPAG